MRLHEFVTVQMQRVSEQKMAVIEGKAKINLDALIGIMPHTIPSEVTGPDGQPVGKPACMLMLPGGQIIVKDTYQEVAELLEGPKVELG